MGFIERIEKEWPMLRAAPYSFVILLVSGLVVGALAIYLLFNIFILPGKDANIDALKTRLDLAEKGITVNDSYDQPLLIGTATVVIEMEPNSSSVLSLPSGYIQFVKGEEALLVMEASPVNIGTRIVNNQRFYRAIFELDQTCKAIGNPISSLAKTEYIQINLNPIPAKSKIADGNAIFVFNGSVPTNIKIPRQTMDGNDIIIKDVQKYFKKGK
jgi:hypothetical protein